MIFDDIFGGFVTLFSDSYAIWFVILASFVGIVFGVVAMFIHSYIKFRMLT